MVIARSARIAEQTRIVNEAAELCPISRLFAGADITVDAVLERS